MMTISAGHRVIYQKLISPKLKINFINIKKEQLNKLMNKHYISLLFDDIYFVFFI